MKALRFEMTGHDPLSGEPLNMVEQPNQTFTILVTLVAVVWLALSSGRANATDAIRLRCSGTVNDYEQNIRGVTNNETLNIDVDQMLMTGLMGTYPVSSINDESIVVELWTKRDDGYTGHIFINVDRMTGKATLIETSNAAPNKMLRYFDLICRSAKQLF
jgi:hypothetical protein